jgi:DNA/RNA-binding domain of Phe-tRNA-synthetase-like protein
MKIAIDPKLLEITPQFKVAVMSCDVSVDSSSKVDTLVSFWENSINETIDIKDVVNLDIIIDGRNAYKKYGKDPSRYRLAVESLYRRISKGNKLYRINNVVDLGNVLSMKTRKSVAVLDYNAIQGDVFIRLGNETDEYFGIGRGKLNITNIPLYSDEIGPFGSVTSDTERTMIQSSTDKILLFIISFSGIDGLDKEIDYAKDIYEQYANGKNFETYII